MERGGPGRGAGWFRAAAVLRDPAYAVLASGFSLVTIAEWTVTTALAIQAYDVGGALAVGLAGARFVPAAVAGVPLGNLGDRFAPAWVLAGTAAARCCAVLLAVLAVLLDAPFPVLLAVAVVDAVVATAYRPAQARLIPALARTPEEVAEAAALLANTKTTSQVIGALIAGLVLASFGAATAFAVPAVLLAFAAVLTAGLAGRLRIRAAEGGERGAGGLDWLAGVRVLRGNRNVAHVAGLAALRSAGRGLWLALATLAALGFLDLGQAGVGLLMALSGVGVLIAIPVSTILVARPLLRGPLVVALALCGVPLVILAVLGEPGPALACVVVWGFGMAFADVIMTAMQFRVVDAPVLSRTVGAIESLKIGSEGVGALLAPLLVALVDVRTAIAIAGIAPILVAILDRAPLARVDLAAAGRIARIRLLRGVPLFDALGVEALERLAAQARRETFAGGVVVITEGDADARDFYVIESGTAEVLLAAWPVATLGPGTAFGERALLRDAPRAATVRAASPLVVQAIGRDAFLSAVTGTASEARLARPRDAGETQIADTLRALPLLAGLGDEELTRLAAAGRMQRAGAGEAIVREGDAGSEMFVVLHGGARVERDGRTVVDLLPGDHFGEIALLHDVPRSATVRATTEALLLVIPREAYLALVGERGAATAAAG